MAEPPFRKDNAVILHHPDAVDTGRERLMGRQAAGAGFLKGFCRHSGVERFYCQVLDPVHAEDFQKRVQSYVPAKPVSVVPPEAMSRIDERARTLQVPDPAIGVHAWRRRGFGQRAYSICGVNHTIASDYAMDGLAELVSAPVQPWDAMICTSQAAKAVMARVLDNYADYLGRRGGGRFRVELKMPVIPLGVDCASFLEGAEAARVRAGLRRGLGIGADDFVALYFGRLSFHAKAHPLAMYLALEEVHQRTGRRMHLIQVGRFPNAGIEREFRDGAARFCPSVHVIFLDGRDDAVSRDVWYAADTFVSLSDNVQESFGLTPVEAMAAGLPVVVTDWNGYRDTVRDGVDGFAVPTWLPLAGSGGDIMLGNDDLVLPETRERNYNQYCGVVSQCTAVDVAKATDALAALVDSPDLRRRMGEAGRRRARENYDWSVIVDAYQDLWRELGHIRSRGDEAAPPADGRPVNPLRDDPFQLFQGYATETVDGETMVELVPAPKGWEASAIERLQRLRVASMNDFAASAMLGDKELAELLDLLERRGRMDVFSLADRLDETLRFRVPRTLAWLAKLGLVRLIAGTSGAAARPAGPEDSETRRMVELGLAARRRGAHQAAVDYFDKALRLDPGDVEANIQIGEVLAGQGRLDAATAAFRRALNRSPNHLPAMRDLGKALFLKGDEKGGIEVMTDAVARAPEDAESRFLLGAAFRRTGEVNKAIRELERALALAPERTDALYHLGMARKSLGRAEDARAAFVGVLERDPRDVFARMALAGIDVADLGRRHVQRHAGGRRVALHLSARGQYPLLQPVFEALTQAHWPLLTCDGRELQEFGPSVVVMAGPQVPALRQIAPDAVIVNLGVGLASKNFLGRVRDPGDFLCASGPSVAAEIAERRGLDQARIWATGYPAMDRLFRAAGSRPAGKRPCVLFAPTDRPMLSSAEMLGADVVELIARGRSDIDIVLKPHPRHAEAPPAWLASWRELAATNANVALIDDPAAPAAAALAAADVLISDASSVMLEYLALDRPIVLISNPERFNDPTHFDSAGYEWAWRDMGEEVHDIELLSEAVQRALDGPGERATARGAYRAKLFGDLTDGEGARRIADRIGAIRL